MSSLFDLYYSTQIIIFGSPAKKKTVSFFDNLSLFDFLQKYSIS